MRTREYNATYPKTPPKTSGNPNFRGDVTSSSPIGDAQWYYYYSSSAKCTRCVCAHDHIRDFRTIPLQATCLTSLLVKMSHQEGIAQLPVAHAHIILPIHDMGTRFPVTSLPAAHTHVITSGSTTSQHHLKYNFVTTYKLLEFKPYSLKTLLLLFVKCVWFHCGISAGQRNITS